jgi:hypothetical protein
MQRVRSVATRFLFIATLAVAASCATPDDIRNEKYLFREEYLPMTLDETEDYIERIVLNCGPHFILRNVYRDPQDPQRLTAVVENTRVSAVVDFEEVSPGRTRVRTYAPFQLFRNSGIRSMYKQLESPCPDAVN